MRCMMAVMLLLGLPALIAAQEAGPLRGRDTLFDRPNLGQQLAEHPELFTPRPDQPTIVVPGTNPAGPVSAADLRVPEKAVKELERSDKALRAGDVRGSAEHLEKALAIYNNWPLGHSALGARYAALSEFDKAMKEYETALKLNPRCREALDNMAAALSIQLHYAEAEPVARRVLEMEPQAMTSQYLLGSILVEEGKCSTEAMALLQKSMPKFPRARIFLAKAEMLRGENEAAEADLREYLKAPAEKDKALAEKWLARVEKQEQARRADEKERASAN